MTNTQSDQWENRLAIAELLTKYFRALDDKDFETETFAAIFTEDATVTRPNDTVITGPAEIAASHRKSLARFRATQHLLTGHDIKIDGDEATVRANLVAIHLWADGFGDPSSLDKHFSAGGVIIAVARRKKDGWRLLSLENRVVWRTGSGFGAMLKTNKE
jgi:uncharacterized protein (TIGR02246 family)